MSFLESLFGSFTDSDDSSSASVQHPCSNCPSNCAVYPEACPVCQPYKEKMIDALYNVEHKDEILAKYEVVGTSDAAATGFITCPYCGGQSANPYVCEYCDSKLQDGSAKIKVSSARDLPNPVLDAQDIIFERYEAVSSFVDDNEDGLLDGIFGTSSGQRSGSFLGSIFSLFTGTDEEVDNMGCKMTEAEIEQMADTYGVSVSSYLAGLDNGIYSTLSAKKREDELKAQYQNQSTMADGMGGGLGMGLGAAGLAALLGSSFTGMGSQSSGYGDLFGGSGYDTLFGEPQSTTYRSATRSPGNYPPPPPQQTRKTVQTQPVKTQPAKPQTTHNNPANAKVRDANFVRTQKQATPAFTTKTAAAPVQKAAPQRTATPQRAIPPQRTAAETRGTTAPRPTSANRTAPVGTAKKVLQQPTPQKTAPRAPQRTAPAPNKARPASPIKPGPRGGSGRSL